MASPPQKLSAVHKHMCALKAAGMMRKDIAEITGYTEAQVTNVLAHPDAQSLVDRLATDLAMQITQDVHLQIMAATGEAFGKVVHLMRNADSERVQQISAFDILDRGGFKPKEVHVNADIQIPTEEAAAIRETLQHMGQEIPHRPPLDNAVHALTKGGDQAADGHSSEEGEQAA